MKNKEKFLGIGCIGYQCGFLVEAHKHDSYRTSSCPKCFFFQENTTHCKSIRCTDSEREDKLFCYFTLKH